MFRFGRSLYALPSWRIQRVLVGCRDVGEECDKHDTYVTEVGTVTLAGGGSSSDLSSAAGTGRAAEGGGLLGTSDLVGLGVLLVGGDHNGAVSVGRDVNGLKRNVSTGKAINIQQTHLGVGKTGVLVRGQVLEVTLMRRQPLS